MRSLRWRWGRNNSAIKHISPQHVVYIHDEAGELHRQDDFYRAGDDLFVGREWVCRCSVRAVWWNWIRWLHGLCGAIYL
jgi:hypothetical protein